MRRLLLILPDVLGDPDRREVLGGQSAALAHVAGQSRLFRLQPLAEFSTPEAAYVGLDPTTVSLEPGPLAVAAIGASPPPDSVCMQLSLMGVQDGIARRHSAGPNPEQAAALFEAAARLSTRSLTALQGMGLEHALVWERGSLDLMLYPPGVIDGEPLSLKLPEGDGERILRRFIDDSVNLLTDLPLNRERTEEGLLPWNLLWPWGAGFQQTLPNLALERAEPISVVTNYPRAAAIARLAGYRPLLAALRECLASLGPGRLPACLAVLVLPPDGMASERRLEQAARLVAAAGKAMEAWLDLPATEPLRISLLLPAVANFAQDGLGFIWERERPAEARVPFDERACVEERLPRRTLWEAVEEAITCEGPAFF